MKVFDLHCDTLSELRRAEMRGDGQTFAHNNGHIDLEKLEKGDYMLQCFAAFVNLADPTPGADPLVTALEEIDVFKRMMEQYSDRIAPVYRPEDIRKNAEAGKISGMLTIEEAGCCKGSLGVLRRMYELGVRMMTLTWNHENELASPNVVPGNGPIWPCMPNTETGLKEKGFEFLAEMERLHIIADVSHLSDKGFWDIAEHSTRPFAASHSKQVGGIEIIGLGSDFDGIGGKLELSDCSKMPLLADALRKEGFTEDEVEAIFFRNAQRFFENNL